MAKAVHKTQRRFTFPEASLGQRGENRGSVKEQVAVSGWSNEPQRWPRAANRAAALAVALVATAFGTPLTDPAQAHHADDLVFADESKLDLKWSDAERGTVVTVCNVGSKPTTGLRVSLAKFELMEDGGVREPEALLELVPVGTPPADASLLAAGECRGVRLKARVGADLDPGDYAGLLVATTAGGVARKQVTLKNAEKDPAVPKSAGKAGVLEGERQGFWGAWKDAVHLTGGGQIAVAVAAPAPAPAEDGDNSFELPPTGTLVGNVFKDNEVGRLYVDGPADNSVEGVVLVPLKVKGIDEVGDYSGSVDVTEEGTAKEADLIPVTLSITDWVGWAIVAIFLGALIPLLSQLYGQRRRPRKMFEKRIMKLGPSYDEAEAKWRSYRKANRALPDLKRPADPKLDRYTDDVTEAIDKYRSGTLFFDTSSDAYKALEASIALVEDDIASFGAKDKLAAGLSKLRKALDELAEFLDTKFPTPRKPRFLIQAATLLEPSQPESDPPAGGIEAEAVPSMEVGEASERIVKAKALVAFIAKWQEMAGDVGRYRFWGMLLKSAVGEPIDRGGMTPPDAERLERARAKVEESRQEMLDADSEEDLEALGAARDLQSAYAELARLGSRYKIWVPPGWHTSDPPAETVESMANNITIDFTAVRHRYFADRQAFGSATGLLEGITGAATKAASALVLLAGNRKLWDWLTIAVSVAVAVAGGLTLFYFGETFGSTADYLTVIAAGTGAALLTKALTDALTLRLPGVAPGAATVASPTEPAKAGASTGAAPVAAS